MENSGQIRDNMIIYENRRVEFSLCRRKIQLNNYGSMVKRLRLSPLTAHNNRRMKISRDQNVAVGENALTLNFAVALRENPDIRKLES